VNEESSLQEFVDNLINDHYNLGRRPCLKKEELIFEIKKINYQKDFFNLKKFLNSLEFKTLDLNELNQKIEDLEKLAQSYFENKENELFFNTIASLEKLKLYK
jgi:hypothetical protein